MAISLFEQFDKHGNLAGTIVDTTSVQNPNSVPNTFNPSWSQIVDDGNLPANGATKNNIFAQNSMPLTGFVEGDLWFDTNDNNTTYRANDSLQWVSVKDGSIANKITTFAQASIPTSLAIGDLWIDTDDSNKLYRAASVGADQIIAGEWVSVAGASGITTFTQAAVPTSLAAGDLWFDSDDSYKPYRATNAGDDEVKVGEWVAINFADIGATVGATFGTNISGGGSAEGQVGNNGYITSLGVNRLAAGSISSKAITLVVADGTGDSYIAATKTNFNNTEAGFILGVDDSDSNKAKFYIGNSTNFFNWDGTNVVVQGKIQTAATGKRIVIDSSDNSFTMYDTNGNGKFAITDLGGITMQLNEYTAGNTGFLLRNQQDVAFTGRLLDINVQKSTSTGKPLYINNAGTGNSLEIVNTSTAKGIYVDVDGGIGIDLVQSSSAIAVNIYQGSVNEAIFIDYNNSTNYGVINIDLDANDGNNCIGIKMNITNGGAGTEYAFHFEGSEYDSSKTGVSGLVGVLKVITGDGPGYIPIYDTAT